MLILLGVFLASFVVFILLRVFFNIQLYSNQHLHNNQQIIFLWNTLWNSLSLIINKYTPGTRCPQFRKTNTCNFSCFQQSLWCLIKTFFFWCCWIISLFFCCACQTCVNHYTFPDYDYFLIFSIKSNFNSNNNILRNILVFFFNFLISCLLQNCLALVYPFWWSPRVFISVEKKELIKKHFVILNMKNRVRFKCFNF